MNVAVKTIVAEVNAIHTNKHRLSGMSVPTNSRISNNVLKAEKTMLSIGGRGENIRSFGKNLSS
jgi:hypothetical protein